MAQTFVYNLGTHQKTNSKTIHLEFGLFFDGTLNNKENTELRLKVLNQNDLKILPSDDEKEVKRKEKKLEFRRFIISDFPFEFMIPNKYKKNIECKKDITDYRRADKRNILDRQGVDNSLMNDYTNVARMWNCCNRNYRIYIEGIGTLDKQKDISVGFQFGSGDTGIRGKVRKGCYELAKKIKEKLPEETDEVIKVTLDAFGFSRGAAAARNFLYEVNSRNKREKDFEIYPQYEKVRVSVPIAHDPYDFFAPNDMIQEERIVTKGFKDKDGIHINDKLLENGRMPKYGYLGYYLLEMGVNPKILERLYLRIRFVGLYDTVSSYEEFGNISGLNLLKKGIQHSKKSFFENDVEQLQLNNIGAFEKAIHFTAMNEHRENFALTKIRVENCIEKTFPGVHCDIGGAYETGTEYVDEIDTSNHTNLNQYQQKIISEYWYKKEQLSQSFDKMYFKLSGTRFLRKEYSYIPLHFMQQFFNELLGNNYANVISKNIVTDYPISDPQDEILIKVKEHLRTYVFRDEKKAEENRSEEEKEWTFISDEEIKKTFGEEKGSEIIKKDILRILRNKYLHWSANRDWFGMEPASGRIRKEY